LRFLVAWKEEVVSLLPWLNRSLCGYLIGALFVIGSFPAEGWAVFLPSDFASSERLEDLKKLQTFLESKVVRQRLADLGMRPQQVQADVAQLSDQEIHQLAQHTELLVPGGDAVGFVIAVRIVGILVIILLQLTGHRIIITK